MNKELVHGRPSTYNNHKCRCRNGDHGPVGCTEAWAEYIRERGYVRKYQARKRQEAKAAEVTLLDLNEVNEEAILRDPVALQKLYEPIEVPEGVTN